MGMEDIKISVIIPVYGVEKYIEECAISLFEQTIQDKIEFIFINDNTKDKSIYILNKVLERYPTRKNQVRIINNDRNKGVAKVRQIGTDKARGKYIIHCDSDDWIEPNMYEEMYKIASKYNADIVSCGFILEYEKRKKLQTFDSKFERKEHINYSIPNYLSCSLWNKLIKKELYTNNNIRYYNGINMSEDIGITTRLRWYSNNTILLKEPLYHYRIRKSTSLSRHNIFDNFEQQTRCVKNLIIWSETNKIDIPDFIKQLKLLSKFTLLSSTLLNNVSFWKKILKLDYWNKTFPEVSNKIYGLPNYSIFSKILAYSMTKKLYFITFPLLILRDLKNSL